MRVLIVEDEQEIAAELSRGLSDHGFHPVTAHTGQAALSAYADADVVLLDLGLPDLDGFAVCRTIRAASTIPIIFVTARSDEFDRVLGLKLGADDYVVKPFGLRELAARVEAVTRRTADPARECAPGDEAAKEEASTDGRPRSAGPVRIDLRQRRVTVHGRETPLTRKEFDLLALLTEEPGRVFDREIIMRKVWGYEEAGDTRTLGVHMASLRKKLGTPRLIETVRGIGFRVAS